MSMDAPVPVAEPVVTLRELARLFLKLGLISFGGPAAHIALMRHEVVERRGWLTNQEFLDLVGATSLIPGPNSTEIAIHVGRSRGGWPGLLVAGTCFILPAVLIVGALAALYVRAGALPEMAGLFYGIKPVVIAVVAIALWQLARTAVRSVWDALLAVGALILVAAGLHELLVLAIGGFIAGIARTRRWLHPWRGVGALAIAAAESLNSARAATRLAAISSSAVAATASMGTLFLVFLKAGAFLFGSGYVLLAFLRADLVDRLSWLTEQQLLDAIAVGQVTPGPVFTTATFVGYLLGDVRGAAIATIAIFLPAFIYVALSAPLVPRLRRSAVASGVLDGVNIASLALMAAVTWQLGRAALIDVTTAAVSVVSLALLLRWRVNPTWLIGAGAVIGLVAFSRS